jgi:GDP-mannose pyrophosphatase NudK
MNPKVTITTTEILSNKHYTFKRVSYTYQKSATETQNVVREVFDRGNGAAILLYNKEQGTVILTKQFRLPTYLNGNATGNMIEVCAGTLEIENPEECIIRETQEETGYKISKANKVAEVYMSPGAVTEILYLFVAEYTAEMKVSEGGGLVSEHENIEVMEVPFIQALSMMKNGEICDAKTVILLQHAQINQLV